jgi:sugar lactone lactonase YvrE
VVRELAAALVADTRCGLGESPFWDETTGEIAWLDIEAGTMLRHRDGGEISKVELAPEVTFAAMTRRVESGSGRPHAPELEEPAK